MASEWFYTVNGQQAATPISDAELKRLATTGQLKPEDLIWKEGMPNWSPASSIKGLFVAGPSSVVVRPGSAEVPSLAVEPAAPPTKKAVKKKADEVEEEGEDQGGGLLALPPVVVFLISVVTLSLFGIVYGFLVCSAYARREQPETDSAGRPLGRLRHPLAIFLLSYLTLGFYFKYWAYKSIQECAAFTGRKDINARIELALMLALPGYWIYVAAFRLPEMIRAAQRKPSSRLRPR